MSKKLFQLFMFIGFVTIAGVFSYGDAANALMFNTQSPPDQNTASQQSEQKADTPTPAPAGE